MKARQHDILAPETFNWFFFSFILLTFECVCVHVDFASQWWLSFGRKLTGRADESANSFSKIKLCARSQQLQTTYVLKFKWNSKHAIEQFLQSSYEPRLQRKFDLHRRRLQQDIDFSEWKK